jgi:hypothetical protein
MANPSILWPLSVPQSSPVVVCFKSPQIEPYATAARKPSAVTILRFAARASGRALNHADRLVGTRFWLRDNYWRPIEVLSALSGSATALAIE